MVPEKSKRLYYPALDGLRGIGCLLVVIYHNFWFFHKYLFFGWVAMDIFFVLSGFLITDILVKSFGKENYLKNFYIRRILRVFPLYYTALFLFIVILPRVPSFPIPLDQYVHNQIWYWTFLQNWVIIFKGLGDQTALMHLWSMAVEEQFYLLWPLVFAFIKKPKYLIIFLSALLISLIIFRFWLWMKQVPGLSYFNFFNFTRIDGICIGCIVALLQNTNSKLIRNYTFIPVFSLAIYNFLFYFLNLYYKDYFPYLGLIGFTTFATLLGILVYSIINQTPPILSKVFDISLLKFIGRISYGTYIFHWPIYLFIKNSSEGWAHAHIPGIYSDLSISVLSTILAYVTGYLSYRYFESYFLRLKNKFI